MLYFQLSLRAGDPRRLSQGGELIPRVRSQLSPPLSLCFAAVVMEWGPHALGCGLACCWLWSRKCTLVVRGATNASASRITVGCGAGLNSCLRGRLTQLLSHPPPPELEVIILPGSKDRESLALPAGTPHSMSGTLTPQHPPLGVIIEHSARTRCLPGTLLQKKTYKATVGGWGHSSLVECLLCVCESLS